MGILASADATTPAGNKFSDIPLTLLTPYKFARAVAPPFAATSLT